MASKKSKKSTIKKAKKLAKKNPTLFIVLVLIALTIVGVVFILWKMDIISFGNKPSEALVTTTTKPVETTTITTTTQEPTKTEQVYVFNSDLKCYRVIFDSESNTYKVKEEQELIKGNNYILAKETNGVLSLYILEGNETKEVQVDAIPLEVSLEYIWTCDEFQGSKPTFKKLSGIAEDVIYDDFQIHFMMLGNDAAGDCAYIKAGDKDILIDAGSAASSYATTNQYIKQYCKDNSFEYVIATHGDQDHIAAFPSFFKNYQVDTVIDFSCETYTQYQAFKETKKSTRDYFSGTTKTTATYGAYLKARDTYANHHYTAGDCYKNINGAKRSYKLSDNVTMDILYNYYYYDNNNDGKVDSTDENNFSVLTLFTYKQNGKYHRFFLGGDLEKEGEEKFAEYYDGSTEEKTMPKVDLYKAGHHGSKTSSNDCLLDILQPKLCVCCCCCGTDEYTPITNNQFPTQDFINRIAKWTDKVYAPSIFDSYEIVTAAQAKDDKGNLKYDKKGNPVSDRTGVAIGEQYAHTSGYKAMNGNIIVSCNGSSIGLWASNNLIKLKDSEWFNSTLTLDGIERKMRVWPSE